MFSTVFLIFFTLLLIFLNVYCFVRKKYFYLFMPCLLFLPIYYGIEISDTFPLITVTRIMYIVFFIYALCNRRRNINFKEIKIREIPKEYYLLFGYFVFRVASNLRYISIYGQASKTILAIVIEQLFLLIAVYLLAPNKEELLTSVRVIVWVASILFVVGIFESIFNIRPFDALYTVSRELYNIPYYRLGLLRATTTMYAPALYGNMCILVLPLILYLFETTRTKIYLVVSGLCVLAVIHSGSRADMIFLPIILVGYCFFILRDKNRRCLFIKNCCIVTLALFLFMAVASVCNSTLQYFYIGNAKSILNEIGFDFDLNEGAPDESLGYGNNKYGSASRIRQFTGMYYVAKINPVFGMGANATSRGDVQYYWHFGTGNDKWITAKVYDVGIVEVFCDEGLLGLLGMGALMLFMVIKSCKRSFYKLAVLCYLLAMLSTKNMYTFLMMYLIMFINYDANNEKVLMKPIQEAWQ